MAQEKTERIDSRAYRTLRRDVGNLLQSEGGAAERERATRYWEVGKRIHEVLAPHGERAGYGEQVVSRLAQDVDVRRRLLYDMLRLFRVYPILHARAQLGWTHYRILLRVEPRKEREFYTDQTAAQEWSSRQLEMHIQENLYERVHGKQSGKWLDLPRGRPYTYGVVEREGAGPRLELGFGIRVGSTVIDLEGVADGDVVESVRSMDGSTPFRARRVALQRDEIYTYGADVTRVVDGDTLRVEVGLGFGIETEQTIRLRGIDAPEMSEEDGVRARLFVAEALGAAGRVVITTRRRDKYGRWLSDVYYESRWRSVGRIAREGRLLNRELVAGGLAARYR